MIRVDGWTGPVSRHYASLIWCISDSRWRIRRTDITQEISFLFSCGINLRRTVRWGREISCVMASFFLSHKPHPHNSPLIKHSSKITALSKTLLHISAHRRSKCASVDNNICDGSSCKMKAVISVCLKDALAFINVNKMPLLTGTITGQQHQQRFCEIMYSVIL